MISEPGAKISTQEPKLDHDDRESRIVAAPTVMAEAERAGDIPHASFPLFPAATVTWTPASVSYFSKNFPSVNIFLEWQMEMERESKYLLQLHRHQEVLTAIQRVTKMLWKDVLSLRIAAPPSSYQTH